MKTKALLIVLLAAISFSSCQKEASLQNRGGEKNDKILGTWNFVGMDVDLTSEITAGSGVDHERMLSHYTYTSTNNKGTLTFDASKSISNNLSHTFNTVVFFKYFVGGSLIDEFEIPMEGDMPPSNGSVEYKVLSEDSLYFEKGFTILEAPDGQGAPTTHNTLPTTVGLAWAKDTMILTVDLVQFQEQVINGLNARVKNDVRQVIKLKK